MLKVFIFLSGLLLSTQAFSSSSLSLGLKVISGEWRVDSGASSSDIQQNGSQLGINLSYQQDKFFSGISLQGGTYDFGTHAPDQITVSGAQAVSSSLVEHGEFDLLAGYYFFDQTAFFVDLKTSSDKWLSNDYQQNFSGIGVGVSGFYPMNNDWIVYGSFGFIVNAKLKDEAKNTLADAASIALEIAASYRLSQQHALGFGLKSRSYTYTLNDDSEQSYTIGGLFVNYQYRFDQ